MWGNNCQILSAVSGGDCGEQSSTQRIPKSDPHALAKQQLVYDLTTDEGDERIDKISNICNSSCKREGNVEFVQSKKVKYSLEQKESIVSLLADYAVKYGGSERDAYSALATTFTATGGWFPSRSTIQDWVSKSRGGCIEIDNRCVNEAFEKAVEDKLWCTVMEDCLSKDGCSEAVINKISSTAYSHEMCTIAGEMVAKEDKFKDDMRIKRIKHFSTQWAHGFLQRANKRKWRISSKEKGAMIGPRILSTRDIDILGCGENAVKDIKVALKERGSVRKNGFSKPNLAVIVQELKDIEMSRHAASSSTSSTSAPTSFSTTSTAAPVSSSTTSTAALASSLKKYCVNRCTIPNDDETLPMVKCSTKQCPHGIWFHLKCVRATEADIKGKWYCPKCFCNLVD